MGCCYGHGHGPWCHWDHGYGPPAYEPSFHAYPRRRRGRRLPDEEYLERYLEDLEDEIAHVREELRTVRRPDPSPDD